MKLCPALAALLGASLLPALPLTADVFEVGPGGFSDIQSAIDAASDGDEILVSPGVYRDTDGDGIVALIYEKAVTIRANGVPGSVKLEYSDLQQAIVVRNESMAPIGTAVIDGVRIQPIGWDSMEWSTEGGALQSDNASVRVHNCFFDDNDGPSFIRSTGPNAEVEFTSCDFHQNDSVLQMRGTGASFNDCKFWSSSTRIDIDSPWHEHFRQSAYIADCSFEEQGACVKVSNFSSLEMTDCDFVQIAPISDYPRSTVSLGTGSTAVISGCDFRDIAGTAVQSNEALLFMTGCIIEGAPGLETRGVDIGGDAPFDLLTSGYHVELHGVRFLNCNSESGGALDIQSCCSPDRLHNVLVNNCEFSGNHTNGRGAAIYVEQSQVDITNCEFLGNSAASDGHAILTSGGALGYTRIMNNLFKDNGDSTPSSVKTVFNDGMNMVQCFENRFCGDAGDALGGSAISTWDNLLAGACWADFPNPRGISEFIHMPIVTADAMAVLATDQAIATGGTSNNAMAEATFDSFPILADAYTNGVLEACAPTENGLIYELHAMGQLHLQPGGEPNPLDVESRVGFTPRLEVSTTEEQVLDITIDSRDGAPEFSFWSHMSHTIAVQNADTGELLTPVIDDPAGSYWRYHLPADGSYLIDVDFECWKMLTASFFETVGSSIDGYFDIEFEFQREGEGDGGEEEALAGDLDGNNIVNGADLGLMLSLFGGQNPKGDLDQNGSIDGGDLGMLLANWSN